MKNYLHYIAGTLNKEQARWYSLHKNIEAYSVVLNHIKCVQFFKLVKKIAKFNRKLVK